MTAIATINMVIIIAGIAVCALEMSGYFDKSKKDIEEDDDDIDE